MLRYFLIVINLVLILQARSITQHLQAQCLLGYIFYPAAGGLITLPVLFRLAYIRRVQRIIQAFFTRNADQQLAKAKEKRYKTLIYTMLAVIMGSYFFFFLTLTFQSHLRYYGCICHSYLSGFNIGNLVSACISFPFELAIYIRHILSLCSHRALLRYKIREELFCLLIISLLMRPFSIYFQILLNCTIAESSFYSSPLVFIQYFLDFLFLTVLVPYPLIVNANSQSRIQNIESLMFDFPEALFFWAPNLYFNLFLHKHYPQHQKYRPLIADILRYDYQIEESNSKKIPTTSSNSSPTLLEKNFSQNQTKVHQLVLYIGERYFREESKGFCNFDDQPEVLQNILEKYSNLEENLDQFLFQFVRPYIEARLTPYYEEFIDSRQFQQMKKEIQAGEMFEWLLAQPHR